MPMHNCSQQLTLAVGDAFITGAGIPAATRIMFESTTLILSDIQSLANHTVTIRDAIVPFGPTLGNDEVDGHIRVFFSTANPLSDSFGCDSFDLTDLPILPFPTIELSRLENTVVDLTTIYISDVTSIWAHTTGSDRISLTAPNGRIILDDGLIVTSPKELFVGAVPGVWRATVSNPQGVKRTASLTVLVNNTDSSTVVDPVVEVPAIALRLDIGIEVLQEVYTMIMQVYRATSITVTLRGRDGIPDEVITRAIATDPEKVTIEHEYGFGFSLESLNMWSNMVQGEYSYRTIQVHAEGPGGTIDSDVFEILEDFNNRSGSMVTFGPIG